MPARFNSEIGRTEYLLVNLVDGPDGLAAYPLGKGSGSVTTFSRADGFVVIPRDAGIPRGGRGGRRSSRSAGGRRRPTSSAIGSHCVGPRPAARRSWASAGSPSKTLWVGSQGGLIAAGRGECDVAGVHLLDPATDTYNLPFLPAGVRLLPGYGRMQGVVFRPGDARFEGRSRRRGGRRARSATRTACSSTGTGGAARGS